MEQHNGVSESSPAEEWSAAADKRALDELFTNAGRYSSSQEFLELTEFTRRFRHYSPYNALLVHAQKPGATFALRASEWRDRYERTIKPGARPLVALQPMGPVMFLYDVSDTEGKDLPRAVTAPFSPGVGSSARSWREPSTTAPGTGFVYTGWNWAAREAGASRQHPRGPP